MDIIRNALFDILNEINPMTVRQVFYQAVSKGVIDKTEGEYKGTICRLLGEMRQNGEIPFGWIADSTRWMRKPQTHSSLESMLRHSQRTYRRSVWDNQNAYVEIWLEKDALAGVLIEETDPFDVPLMVTRGYSSTSFLYGAAEEIKRQRKPTYLYYFGDHDPSGVDIPRTVEAGIRKYAPKVDLHFERVAVNEDQMVLLDLPTRPTKKTDTRSKNFVGESVEVDSIDPKALRFLAKSCIERHINPHQLEQVKLAEKLERESIREILENMALAK